MRKILLVKVVSKTIQKFNGEIYYKCGSYFQKGNKRLHREVYIFHKGKITKGFHVHHKKSHEHNQIFNLELLSAKEHRCLHHKQNPIFPSNICIERSRKWHKSEEGIKWHENHYEQNKDNFHRYFDRTCTYCGKEIRTKRKNGNVYCSPQCGYDYRRESGMHDIEKICVVCLKPYIANKCNRGKTCSKKCSSILRSRRYNLKEI